MCENCLKNVHSVCVSKLKMISMFDMRPRDARLSALRNYFPFLCGFPSSFEFGDTECVSPVMEETRPGETATVYTAGSCQRL